MTTAESRRWYRLTPDRLILALLPTEGLLYLSERFRWFPFNEHKGWTVLIALASVSLVLLLMLLWLAAALLFRVWFQFSLRALFVLTLAVALPCSWLAAERNHAQEQGAAVEEIRKLGGRVGLDYDPYAPFGPPAEPPVLAWLRKLLGDNFFTSVMEVSLEKTHVTDAGLKNLRRFTRLWGLNLTATEVTDAGLENLRGLIQLRRLRLNGAKITGRGLKHLKDLPHLEELRLGGAELTDPGLEGLKGLTQLQILELHGANITDCGLEHLAGLAHLEDLDLDATQLTDAGLEQLVSLAQLRHLSLAGTKVTDAGLKHLARLVQLQSLCLAGTKVTNAGLKYLNGLAQLQGLYLGSTQVTDAGLQHLKTLGRLEELDLSGTRVNGAGLTHLKRLTQMRELVLLEMETDVDEAAVADLKRDLPRARVAFSIHLTAEDIKAIRRFLAASEFRRVSIVGIYSADGGGAEVQLRVPPHTSGTILRMKKMGGRWEIVAGDQWISSEQPSHEIGIP